MMLVASYLLKVIACSGLLFLYYHLALRNKLFHQWNRFYLLSAAILSLIIPVVQITISHSMEEKGAPIQLLKVVESANSYLDDVTVGSHSAATPGTIALVVYAIISVFLLLSLIISLVKIISIAKRYGARVIMNVKFINTDVAGTPFSFFRYIFWNESIDLQSENGQRIFEHELVHVKEKHTIDKIMMEVLIILFWCNPFFWLMRQELKMIHEFIADQKAVGEHGAAAFAAMVLQASYSKQFHSITNQFFQTSIKRRLQMITKIQNPKLSYFSRIIALPIIAILVLAFTLRTKELSFIKLEKTFTVVVDAGHGFNPNGTPNGVRINDLTEDDLVLSISKKIQQLNPNENVKVILTRNNKDIIDLRERVSVAERANADLFISLHINADVPGTDNSGNSAYNSSRLEGMQIYVSNKQTPFQLQSETFGSILGKQLEPIYTVDPVLLRRKVGIWVLDKNVCPAVMLECGFLTNDKDRQFISKEENQKLIAEKVLSAIQQYAKAKEDGTLPVRPALIQNDTTPKQYYKGKEVISVNVNKQ
ncbi:MAG: N-acetylmuramoyl-L-alanine amidase, partial [Candidatus Dadabacteria bacterium]